MNKPVLVIGSGGHASVVLEALALQSQYSVVGLLDSFQPAGSEKHGFPILGSPERVAELAAAYCCHSFFVAVGDNWFRDQISSMIRDVVANAEFITAIHPAACISRSASVGPGSIALAGAVIGVNARIAEGCILNTSCSVDHDCQLQAFSSVGPGAHIGGNVVVSARSAVGIGATLREKILVGADTVIGAGAAVVSDLPEHVVAFGVPARVVRQRTKGEKYI